MAATTASQASRRKPFTYGNQRSKSAQNVDSFFSDGEDELAQPNTQRVPSQSATAERLRNSTRRIDTDAPVVKPGKLTRPRSKRQDPFDVPSSDEEAEYPAFKNAPLARSRTKKALIDDTVQESAPLAPWERAREGTQGKLKDGQSTSSLHSEASECQNKKGKATIETFAERRENRPSAPQARRTTRGQLKTKHSPTTEAEEDAGGSSAVAKLAARTKVSSGSGEKSLDSAALEKRPAAETAESVVRKRARPSQEKDALPEVVLMRDEDVTMREAGDQDTPPSGGQDIYDLPMSDAEEKPNPKPALRRGATRTSTTTGKLTRRSPIQQLRKGASAPAQFAHMMPGDIDSTEAPTRSPSESPGVTSSERPATPPMSTPPSQNMASPETAVNPAAAMTPRQRQLWKNLLPTDPAAPSPSALPMDDLRISGDRRTRAAVQTQLRKLTKAQSDIPRRRTRLVDRLKASASSSDEEDSGEEDTLPTLNDNPVEMPATASQKAEESSKLSTVASQTQRHDQSQSQSQTYTAVGGGPNITYSRTRTYLPEDTFEDGLMAGLTNDTPKQALNSMRTVGVASTSQPKDPFDMDESEDEDNAPGGIRTAHELRAAGRNIRGKEDIEQLMDEIRNHSPAQKSRRRSAMMELATKLTDPAFMERFVGQSYEVQLAAECSSSSDDIANFILTAAMALVMEYAPPAHAINSICDHGVIAWLAKSLSKDAEVGKLAKERGSNMARAAQTSFIDFARMVQQQDVLWGEQTPGCMSLRLISLKALDRLVGKMRRLGDKSALLAEDELGPLTPDSNHAHDNEKLLEISLSVSILESLAITSQSLDWPSKLIEGASSLLPELEMATPTSRHTLFLALRLCLQLTGENSRNCSIISTKPVVDFLLSSIQSGFLTLDESDDDNTRTVALDLLILSNGLTSNLAENSPSARSYAAANPELLASLARIFIQGQNRIVAAESMEESTVNVAYGYLAIMLANLCEDEVARKLMQTTLPGRGLDVLMEAVEEFVAYHEKVDMMNFAGEEGAGTAHTEKLRGVLTKIRNL